MTSLWLITSIILALTVLPVVLTFYDIVIHASPSLPFLSQNLLVCWVSFFLQNERFAASDFIWWCGLTRILEDRGFIREGDEMV